MDCDRPKSFIPKRGSTYNHGWWTLARRCESVASTVESRCMRETARTDCHELYHEVLRDCKHDPRKYANHPTELPK